MQMRRSIGVPLLRRQQAPHHAVGRNGVAHHLDGAEPEAALGVGDELSAQVHVRLAGILILVETDRGGVPDIDVRAGDRIARPIDDAAGDEQRVAGRVGPHDRAAVLDFG